MILVDDRAGSVDLIPLFPPELTKKTRLEAGDVAFLGYGPEGPFTLPIGIEYKTAREALQCMQTGRLTGEQMPKMSQIYKRVYIVIEGEYREGSDGILQFLVWNKRSPLWTSFSRMPYRAFDNWLNSISEVGHVIIKRSTNRSESATIILDLYYFWAKEYDKHISAFRLDKSQEPTLLHKPSPTRLIASKLPGVGHELDARVSAHFNNPHQMVNAEVEEWMKIPGVGKMKAQKIYNWLRGHSTH